MYDADDTMWTIILVVTVLVFGLWAVHSCQVEGRRQDKIIEECTLIRHTNGQTVLVSTGKGMGVGGTGDQRCYRCPNGIEECF